MTIEKKNEILMNKTKQLAKEIETLKSELEYEKSKNIELQQSIDKSKQDNINLQTEMNGIIAKCNDLKQELVLEIENFRSKTIEYERIITETLKIKPIKNKRKILDRYVNNRKSR